MLILHKTKSKKLENIKLRNFLNSCYTYYFDKKNISLVKNVKMSNRTLIHLSKTNIITFTVDGVIHLENAFIFEINAMISELFCL